MSEEYQRLPRDFVAHHEKRRRLRDLSQYYCATSPNESTWNAAAILGAGSSEVPSNSVLKWTPRPPNLAADPVLTSLVQAAALRLGVERCLVSIIDDQHQHVIAEATRSISPFDINHHDPGDEVLIGAQSLPNNWGVCSTALSAFVDNTPLRFSQPGNICSQSGILISDLVAENCSCFVPAVLQNRQRLRFYAGVPLLSTVGTCVGVVCVFDPNPRTAKAADLETLRTSARVISQYLSTMRLQVDNSRAQRLLGGLTDFILQTDVAMNQHTALDKLEPNWKLQSDATAYRESLGSLSLDLHNLADAEPRSVTKVQHVVQDLHPAMHSEEDKVRESAENDPFTNHGNSHSGQSDSTMRLSEDTAVPENIMSSEATFVRASRIIQQSMDLDGSCFFEIPHEQRLRLTKSAASTELHGRQKRFMSHETSATSGPSSDDTSSSNNSPSNSDPSRCLAFSTVDDDNALHAQAQLTEHALPSSFLIKLSSRYTKGHVFHFDNLGGVTSDEDDLAHVHSRPQKTSRIADQVWEHFGPARSLIFLPLHDNIGQCAYAGFFGWTNTRERSLQERDLIYVSGFANNIMSEVMRRQSQELANIKSDFISSISHELRSPLHGVLAANQLLSESTMSREQSELVKTVENCAVTLLDILNQLFDYAKITTFGKSYHATQRKNQKRNAQQVSQSKQIPLGQLCLGSLVEKAISSLVTHASYLNSPIAELDLSLTYAERRASVSETSSFIIVDVDLATCQQSISHSGLWRIVILNLLGNAIKFTKGGHIHVALKLHQASRRHDGTSIAELCIRDTGKGMSEYFLRNRCFEPYAQEDSLSVGTGVGLSIVKRTVDLLQGSIKINSKLGSGTEVVVKVPMTFTAPKSPEEIMTTSFALSESGAFRDIKFHVVGISGLDHDESTSNKEFSEHRIRWHLIEAALTSFMNVWLHSQATSKEEADVVFIAQHDFQSHPETYDMAGLDVVVIMPPLCQQRRTTARFANLAMLHSPLGPQCIITALQTLKEQRSNRGKVRPEPATDTQQRPSLHHPEPSHDHEQSSTVSNSSSELISPSGERSFLSTLPDKRLILLVDDNELNLRILRIMVQKLKIQDMESITAADGQQALDRFTEATDQGRSVPFVFMDISMPVMDGMEATRRIRQYETSKRLPESARAYIVAVTGLSSAKDQREVLASGVDTYVAKPANLDALRHILLDRKIDLHDESE